jgi:hypothetical protein
MLRYFKAVVSKMKSVLFLPGKSLACQRRGWGEEGEGRIWMSYWTAIRCRCKWRVMSLKNKTQNRPLACFAEI